jgi:hypothetical protein
MTGCANNMALKKGQDSIDLSGGSIALLTVKISNQNKPDYQPFPFMVFIEGTGAVKFDEDGPHKSENNRYNEYLLTFNLKPGINKLDKIWFDYRGAFMGARASIPMNLEINIKPNSIYYIGHIDIVIRPKKNDNEDSAGSNFPFVNQATAGFSTGTYDVVVGDRFNEDMKWFISEYPVLRTVNVEKSILLQWVRPVNMK